MSTEKTFGAFWGVVVEISSILIELINPFNFDLATCVSARKATVARPSRPSTATMPGRRAQRWSARSPSPTSTGPADLRPLRRTWARSPRSLVTSGSRAPSEAPLGARAALETAGTLCLTLALTREGHVRRALRVRRARKAHRPEVGKRACRAVRAGTEKGGV